MNPKTQETSSRLNLIRMLSSAPNGLSMEELKKASGINSETELKRHLGKLYMVGTYPYSPFDYLEVDYDGANVRLFYPHNTKQSLALTPRDWVILRDSLEKESYQHSKSSVLGKSIESSLAKIKKIVPYESMVSFSDDKKTIQTAIQNSKSLEFSYRNRDQETSQSREVYPWLLLENKNSYLIGYCLNKKSPRVFRLESILNLKATTKQFTPPSREKIQSIMSDFQKFTQDSSSEGGIAVIWHTRESHYYLNQIFQISTTSELKKISGRDYLKSTCSIREKNWFLENFIGFLPSAFIEDPEDLVNELRERIKTARKS